MINSLRNIVVFFGVVLACALYITSAHVSAVSNSPWLSTGNLQFSSNPVAASASPQGGGNAIFCTPDTKFISRPARTGQSEQSYTTCAYRTAYGLITPNNQLLRYGTSVAGQIKSPTGSTAMMVAAPNSDKAVHYYYNGSQWFGKLYQSMSAATMNPTVSLNGEVSYTLPAPGADIKDAASNNLAMHLTSISFSENGQWIVFDSPYKAMIRYNLSTHEAVPFAPSSINQNSSTEGRSIITNDGRHVIVRGSYGMRVYDLNTCAAVPSAIVGPVSCEYKDITSQFNNALSQGGYTGGTGLSFSSDNSFVFYGQKFVNNQIQKAKFRFLPPGYNASNIDYLSIGDSFASGEGAFVYHPETDNGQNNCHLSKRSVSVSIVGILGLSNAKHAACSGAVIDDVLTAPQKQGQAPASNLLGQWLPGAKRQLDYVTDSFPNTVTVSMGGNNIDFSKKITTCVLDQMNNTCFPSYEERVELANEINRQFEPLKTMYRGIKLAAAPGAKIFVVGYPKIAAENGSCGINVRLDSNEIKLTNLVVDHLNGVINAASNAEGVKYVDVTEALDGHKLCQADENNIAMHGLTAGNDMPAWSNGPTGAESFHPNQLGQIKLRQAILTATQNFTANMPTSTTNVPPAAVTSSTPLVANAVSQNRPLYNTYFIESLTSEKNIRGSSMQVKVDRYKSLKANASYDAVLHSTPIQLGTVTTNAVGEINTTLNLPSTVPAGMHTLHIRGQSLIGENIDLYKQIYVAHSETDSDGDGSVNEDDLCPTVVQTSADEDGDGKADSCDDYISAPKADVEQLYRARNGNLLNGENVNRIFVERNVTLAQSMLNVTDSDPDQDGWAVVGRTVELSEATIARFWTDDTGPSITSTDKYSPRFAIRSSSNGCIQYKPADLSAVSTVGEMRDIAVEVENVGTCRGQADNADVDGNGVADNQQALYRARNGNVSFGEDADLIYIERNTAAAEAILHLSDYDADMDGWATVGVSSPLATGTISNIGLLLPGVTGGYTSEGAFNPTMLTLPIEERRAVAPVVAYRPSELSCAALTPHSLSVVVSSQMRSVNTYPVGGAVNCE